jgi:hypothetical protein
MRFIEGKVNIGKNRSSSENAVSSSGAQVESSRSYGISQNRPASGEGRGRSATMRFGQGIMHSSYISF